MHGLAQRTQHARASADFTRAHAAGEELPENIMEKQIAILVEKGTVWGGRIVGVLVALFIAWIVAGWVRRTIVSKLEAREFDQTLTQFFGNLARYAILIGAVIGCLGVFGIQTASFAAVLASAGIAIGLAFQGTLSNFAAGIMLLVFRPFKVGDIVKVAGQVGAVKEIELFTTELTGLSNVKIVIPNKAVFGATIENMTGHETRRVDINVGTVYGADLSETRAVLEAAAPKVAGVLEDPPPQVFLNELGDSAVTWQVRLWCKTEEYWDVWQAGTQAVKASLDEKGIGIPFPQMDVHLDEEAVKALGK